jgi:sec-independent protein translocase protein TatB
MFGIGTWELIVILILALLVLGPDKLPGAARSLGRTLSKLRRTADEVKRDLDLDGTMRQIRDEILDEETRDEMADMQHTLDMRGDIRRAMGELEDPPPLPEPYREHKAGLEEEEKSATERPKDDEGDLAG